MNAKRTEMNQQILAAWDRHDDDRISTAQLLSRVADDCRCSTERVIEAMVEVGRFVPAGGAG